MAPTRERLEELRELYIEREMYNRALDRVLSKISEMLLEEPDYRAWWEEGGITTKLPEWIHQVTGGRPHYGTPQKPVVRRKKKPIDKQQQLASEMYKTLMKGFK